MSYCRILFSLILLIASPLAGAQNASQLTAAQVEKMAYEAVAVKMASVSDAKIIIEPQTLDSRIQLPRCLDNAKAELASNRAINRTNTVRISCSSPDLDYLWQMFLSVRVQITYPVVVTNQTLAPGELINSSNIKLQYLDQHSLRGKQFTDIASLDGVRVKRRVAQGHPIFADNVCFICKGDSVSIYAISDNFQIKTQGEALADGNIGDRIRVRNSKTNKQINAYIEKIGIVSIRM